MKKARCFWKKALACALVAALAVGMLPPADAQARRAAKKQSVKSVAIKCGGKTVTRKAIRLPAGKTASLKVVVKPANAKKKVAYQSSKPSVAKVSGKGKITAKKQGTAKVTVKVTGKNGKKKSAYVKVNVTAKKGTAKPPEGKPGAVAVESVTATISPSELAVGETAQIKAEAHPANATDKRLTYASSNGAVASVDAGGKVTAVAAGTAKITVSSVNHKTAQVAVTVKEQPPEGKPDEEKPDEENPVEASSVTLQVSPSASILVGKTAQITAEVLPEDATDKSVSFSSTDENVAVVDSTGRVTAKQVGPTTIKAETANGKTAELEVTVLETYEVDETAHDVTDGVNQISGRLFSPKPEGTWPTVILSHGYNGYKDQFRSDCTLFAQHGFNAYAFDFCGGGKASQSSGDTTDMTIFTEKANLLAVFNDIKELDGVDPDRIFLLGGSMGGLVTTLAGEELIGQVAGLVLYFPALNVPDDWRERFPTEEDMPKEGETYTYWDLDLGSQFFRVIRDFYTFDNIGTFPDPVLIIWGDQDPIVPRTYVEQAAELYPDAELIVVPGVGHDSSSEIFRESALSFMEETLQAKQ